MPAQFKKLFFTVVSNHFVVDFLNGQRSVLLAYLSIALGMSNAKLALASTVYVIFGSLSQPLFGYAIDRFGPRWLISLGVIWIAGFFMLAVSVEGYLAIIFLILGSIGSGAFHPGGTMLATKMGRNHVQPKETTSAASFFVFGQAGFFCGPLLAGPILDHFGPLGLLPVILLVLPFGFMAMRVLKQPVELENHQNQNGNKTPGSFKTGASMITALVLLATFQSWAQQNMVIFLPKHLIDLGKSASIYGTVAALFMAGTAAGNLIGGTLADRIGKRKVASISLALASIPVILISKIGWSPWLYVLVPLAGALSGASHSIIVVIAQRLVPGGMALASGLILGFMFSSGSLGTLASGYLADQSGTASVFGLTALIVLFASLFARTLKVDTPKESFEKALPVI